MTSDEILVMIDDAARCFQQHTGVRPGKVLLADNLAAVLGYPEAVAGMLVTHSKHCEAVSVFPSYIPVTVILMWCTAVSAKRTLYHNKEMR